MLFSTLVTISLLASAQELSIQTLVKTPQDVAAFNGVSVSIQKNSLGGVHVGETIVVPNFPLGVDRDVTLRLQRFEVFSPDAKIVLGSVNYIGETVHRQKTKPNIVLLRGAIEGDPTSKVFLALGDHTTNGLLESEGSTYVLTENKNAGWTAVYNVNDVDPADMNWEDFYCDVLDNRLVANKNRTYAGGDSDGGKCKAIRVAIDTDWEFTELFEGSVDASSEYAATLIGAASTIFDAEIGVEVQISFLRIWNDDSDPWDKHNALEQLYQLRSYWEENMGATDRHLTHLLSGRSLGGGIAWLNGMCTSYGYGLSANLRGSFPLPLQDFSSNNWDIFVVTHELGHNCSSPHTHEYEPPIDECGNDVEGNCDDADGGTIMSDCHLCPGGMSNIALHFDDAVRAKIANYLLNSTPCNLDCVETELLGACCVEDVCTELTFQNCAGAGGFYFGDGTLCLNNDCEPILGACCIDDPDDSWECFDDSLRSECDSLNGAFLGNNSVCASGWCDPILPIACCLDGDCTNLLADQCEDTGGNVVGLGRFCESDPCYLLVYNDLCETAREVTGGAWNFTTVGATTGTEPYNSDNCPNAFLGDMVYDVWFKYLACTDDLITVSTCESVDFDTDLVVYELDGSGNDCENLLQKQIACNGDATGCSGYTSSVTFQASENTHYLFRVGGFYDGEQAQGDGQLLITGEDCYPDIPCAGDVTADGIVDVGDVLAIISHWLSQDSDDITLYDVDGNGAIDSGDILFIIAHWGCVIGE